MRKPNCRLAKGGLWLTILLGQVIVGGRVPREESPDTTGHGGG